MWGLLKRVVGGAERWVGPLLLLGVAYVALRIGVPDVFSPISLASQLVGLSYLVAGFTLVASAATLISIRRAVFGGGSARSEAAAVVGALTGTYVAGSMAAYAYGYRETRFVELIVGAALCGLLGSLAARRLRAGAIGARLKAAGALLAVLIAGAQLWYTSVYLPENTYVGIGTSATVGTPLRVSRSLELLPVHVTVHNDSSLTAVVLASMYAVTGVHWPSTGSFLADNRAIERAVEVGLGQNTNPEGVSVRYGGKPTRSLLAIGHVLRDGSELFPSQDASRSTVVAIPTDGFQEVEVRIEIDYARQSRLVLATYRGRIQPYRGPMRKPRKNCPPDVLTYWHLRESVLRRFTRGTQYLVTNWCPQARNERVYSNVIDVSDPHSVPHITRNDLGYGLASTTRSYEMFPLRG
jgi:hypothetical protein